MNPNSPIDPHGALEASLTALLLGELPHDQAAALHQKLAQDAELAALYERLKHTIALVRETVAQPIPQTQEPLLPLRISEQRRQKLLHHFKTATPKEFARPRHSPTRWLVPVGIAAVLMALLSALLLPAFAPAKSRSSRLALDQLKLAKEEKYALSLPAGRRQTESLQRGRGVERFYGEGEVRDIPAQVSDSAPEPAQPSALRSAGIVLPQSGVAAGEAVDSYGEKSQEAWYARQPEIKHYYDDRAGGTGGGASGGTFGGFATDASGLVTGAEGRPARTASASDFLGEVDTKRAGQARQQSRTLGDAVAAPSQVSRGAGVLGVPFEPAAPAPPAVAAAPVITRSLELNRLKPAAPAATPAPPSSAPAGGVEIARVPLQLHDGDVQASDLVVSGQAGGAQKGTAITANGALGLDTRFGYWADSSRKPADAPTLGAAVQAGAATLNEPQAQKGVPMAGFAASASSPATTRGFGSGVARAEQMAAAERAGRPIRNWDFDTNAAATDGLKYQWSAQEGVQPNFSVVNGSAPSLGDVPSFGRLYRQDRKEAAPDAKARIEEKVRSTDFAYGLTTEGLGSKADGKADGRQTETHVHNLNVVGYYNIDNIAPSTKAYTPAPTQPARRARSSIALPAESREDTQLAVNEPVIRRARTIAAPKQTQELERLHPEVDVNAVTARKVASATNTPVPQPEVQTADNAFSTFSLNVSDVSFKLAGASLEKGVMPEAASVRSEEFLNAFDYRDPEPPAGVPLAFAWERAQYPFAQGRDLLRFSVKTAALGRQPGRPLNLVLLLDNSGSMERADRVQIIRAALLALANQLQPQDKLSVITFARTPRLFADGAAGSEAEAIALAVSEIAPQGGTNLEEAMNLAYQTARRHYLANGVNRVVLLTDGAANLGNVEPEALKAKVEINRQQGVAFDCFGIGWEGYNDDLLETLSRNGDGRYGFVNTPEEAATEFAGQLAGALRVAASDVKVQVEFAPARVTAYRQIGYAKHQLKKEQFRDNTVDAAELAAAESGNALYVIAVNPAGEGPIATVRARFKVPGTSEYKEHEWPVPYTGNATALEQATPAMRLAATASAFSEWLASSPYAAEATPDRLQKYLSGVPEVYGADPRPRKLEWMLRQARSIAGK